MRPPVSAKIRMFESDAQEIKVFLLLFLQKKKNLLFLKKKKQKNFWSSQLRQPARA
jgi:hypothetical protein